MLTGTPRHSVENVGFEPTTFYLQSSCTTTVLIPHYLRTVQESNLPHWVLETLSPTSEHDRPFVDEEGIEPSSYELLLGNTR